MRFYERFGKYVFLERLGRGGMAEVHLAIAPGAHDVKKFFAVKKVIPENSAARRFIELFKSEAKIAVQLQHPNIVSVFDFGFENGQFFLVMDFVQGSNLSSLMKIARERRKIIPIPLAVFVMREVARALSYAHKAVDLASGEALGMIHRDINAQNVMVSYQGEVKVIDFGVAKATGGESQTPSGLVGKLHSMAPEMVLGQGIDARSDIYSLGVLMWELLTTKKLFDGQTEQEILDKIKKFQVPHLRRAAPFIHEDLEKIVLTCLHKDPQLRYQSADQLLEDLEPYCSKHLQNFGLKEVESFWQEIDAETIRISKEKIREYYNLEFGAAAQGAALAVKKQDAPEKIEDPLSIEQSQVPTQIPSLSKSQTWAPQFKATTKTDFPKSLPEKTAPTEATKKESAKPLEKKSNQWKSSFKKEYYSIQNLADRIHDRQTLKSRVILSLCGFLIIFLAYELIQRLPRFQKEKRVESQETLSNGQQWKAVFGRENNFCLQNHQGKIFCSGDNHRAQLGTGFLSDGEKGLESALGQSFIKLSFGPHHTCGILAFEREQKNTWPVKCWGENSEGQTGDHSGGITLAPLTVDPGVDFKDVAVGRTHSCGLTLDQRVRCWGGAFGSGREGLKEVQLPERIQVLASGLEHLCGLGVSGRLYCWGKNDFGQLGIGRFGGFLAEPQWVDQTKTFTKLSLAAHHSCAITSTGDLWCWGKNDFGQLGLGHTEPEASPKKLLEPRTPFLEVFAGIQQVCATDQSQDLWCWGRNDRGQITDRKQVLINRPLRIPNSGPSSHVALLGESLCWIQNSQMQCRGRSPIANFQKQKPQRKPSSR